MVMRKMTSKKYKECPCGCGGKLTGQKKKYHNQQSCRNKHEVRMLKQGCMPIDRILFKTCKLPGCDAEFITLKRKERETCEQFAESNHGKLYSQHRATESGRNSGKYKPKDAREDYYHALPKAYLALKSREDIIRHYCNQDMGQCRKFHQFSIMDEIPGDKENCFGNHCNFNCYEPPDKYRQEYTSSIASVHKITF